MRAIINDGLNTLTASSPSVLNLFNVAYFVYLSIIHSICKAALIVYQKIYYW